MNKILNRVTVTGADDSIEPSELFSVQEKYPFCEFGILLSHKQTLNGGGNRFPSKEWIYSLVSECRRRGRKPNISAHLCGQWVDGFLSGHLLDFDTITPGFFELIQRIQVNTHAQKSTSTVEMFDVVNWLSGEGKTIIFQLDGRDGTDIAKRVASFGHKNIAGLFDLSHGAGVLPREYPKPFKHLLCGYAGGLSPENVSDQLSIIEKATDGPTWIDAETRLFSESGLKFDLSKVMAFLENAKPWVIGQ